MKAKYVDLPVDKLPHALAHPETWPLKQGREIIIDPIPYLGSIRPPYNPCPEPRFRVLTFGCVTCPCLIELDESSADAEVEAIYEQLHTAVSQKEMVR